jgi:hypothetical protein
MFMDPSLLVSGDVSEHYCDQQAHPQGSGKILSEGHSAESKPMRGTKSLRASTQRSPVKPRSNPNLSPRT